MATRSLFVSACTLAPRALPLPSTARDRGHVLLRRRARPMEISASAAATASTPPAKPPVLLLRSLAASSTAVRRRTSGSATTTVRRRARARARPRTARRSEPPSSGGGEYFSGDDGPGVGGGGYSSGGGGSGGWNWSRGFGPGSGQPDDWEPDVPAPRKSAAEAALGVVYELMCLIALSNCTQFAVRRLAGFLAARVAALRFVPTVC